MSTVESASKTWAEAMNYLRCAEPQSESAQQIDRAQVALKKAIEEAGVLGLSQMRAAGSLEEEAQRCYDHLRSLLDTVSQARALVTLALGDSGCGA